MGLFHSERNSKVRFQEKYNWIILYKGVDKHYKRFGNHYKGIGKHYKGFDKR